MAEFFDLLLSRYTFLTTIEKMLLRDVCGNAQTLMELDNTDISRIIGRRPLIRSWSKEKAQSEAEKAGEILGGGRIKCLFFHEPDYPAQLGAIYDPPFLLYYRGSLPDWNRPLAAVVGTRLATGIGIDAAFELGFEFGLNDIRVVSGLALGIDSAAHSGNTAAGEGSVAVLGCGADRIYPASNRGVAQALLENGGLILSEYPPAAEVRRFNFPERNRIISGLSRAVVVVEAPGKSGALITADFALEQGRDLFVHTAALRSPGNRSRVERLMFDGAPLINKAEDVLSEWGISAQRIGGTIAEQEAAMSVKEAGNLLADNMYKELNGYYIKFNGNYIRRACYESSYSINS
ncbi:MAG: DNA-protecting protein DprA [Spirochaetales bacterium]|nr:DNA-protecting protein DprA [Spirochaetales bacterium]